MNRLDRLAILSSFVALGLLFAGGAYYLKQITNVPDEARDNTQNEIENTQEEQTRRFVASEFGFSFEYPAEWGDVIFTENDGGQGGTKATVEFSNINWFVIGGVSEDFAEGRGGTPTDTQGFVNEDGTYFFKFISTGRVPVSPVKSINTNLGEVIIVDHRSFVGTEEPVGPVMTVGGGNLGALVNLYGETYSGVIFLNTNTTLFTAADFENMLKTLEVK
ncbi:MAG: hypothetical protein WDZ40_03060 [Candidatus Spechtbacterales bacterium]